MRHCCCCVFSHDLNMNSSSTVQEIRNTWIDDDATFVSFECLITHWNKFDQMKKKHDLTNLFNMHWLNKFVSSIFKVNKLDRISSHSTQTYLLQRLYFKPNRSHKLLFFNDKSNLIENPHFGAWLTSYRSAFETMQKAIAYCHSNA